MIGIHMLGEEVIIANSAFKVLQTLKLQHHLYDLKESRRVVLLDHRYNESGEESVKEKKLELKLQLEGNMIANMFINEGGKSQVTPKPR